MAAKKRSPYVADEPDLDLILGDFGDDYMWTEVYAHADAVKASGKPILVLGDWLDELEQQIAIARLLVGTPETQEQAEAQWRAMTILAAVATHGHIQLYCADPWNNGEADDADA